MRRALLAAAITVPAVLDWTTSVAESALDDAVRAYDRATIGNDVATLAELVSDDYVLVNSDSTLQDSSPISKTSRYPGSSSIRMCWNSRCAAFGATPPSWQVACT